LRRKFVIREADSNSSAHHRPVAYRDASANVYACTNRDTNSLTNVYTRTHLFTDTNSNGCAHSHTDFNPHTLALQGCASGLQIGVVRRIR
jgi:hypothetical protein